MSDLLLRDRPVNLFLIFGVAIVLVGGFAAWKFPLWPHGQQTRLLSYDDVMEIGGDPTRDMNDLINADIRAQILVDALKQRLIIVSQQPGQRGENAKALLEKIRR